MLHANRGDSRAVALCDTLLGPLCRWIDPADVIGQSDEIMLEDAARGIVADVVEMVGGAVEMTGACILRPAETRERGRGGPAVAFGLIHRCDTPSRRGAPAACATADALGPDASMGSSQAEGGTAEGGTTGGDTAASTCALATTFICTCFGL